MAADQACAFLAPHLPFTRKPGADSLPHVTLTYAQSLDGFVARHDRKPLPLSGPDSATLTHALRASHDAILVGANTLINDNPSLNTRLVASDAAGQPAQSPRPVILDSTLRTPVSARVFTTPRPRADGSRDSRVIVITCEGRYDRERKRALEEDAGAVVLAVQSDDGRVHLPSALAALRDLGVQSVMVEGGATVIGALLTSPEVRVDLLVVTIAPTVIGRGVHAIGDGVRQDTKDKDGRLPVIPKLVDVQWEQFGADMVMLAKPA
ncbi:2,5-diamino-6-(ribosylamino)-4(3H)-pyrimidinone 5'-phosphate reductase [Geranomyces variabilis]|uniref:2,5-diamino-6-ribosylamino-4(3H)-pyrimidinone 5'-phosphate reductase n=1 Tax=Geranomyces variabilis TaxID=109894 RepID=A0AAD5XLC5_9FUNG|nr:2,5-diamino-6-(ribosylamino)-4(3H)-pyrimidinone 5'-phosphate reductase [Geranomyces variabilis]